MVEHDLGYGFKAVPHVTLQRDGRYDPKYDYSGQLWQWTVVAPDGFALKNIAGTFFQLNSIGDCKQTVCFRKEMGEYETFGSPESYKFPSEDKPNSSFKRVYRWYLDDIQEGYIIDMPDGSMAVVDKPFGEREYDDYPWEMSQLDGSWHDNIESLIAYECNKLTARMMRLHEQNNGNGNEQSETL